MNGEPAGSISEAGLRALQAGVALATLRRKAAAWDALYATIAAGAETPWHQMPDRLYADFLGYLGRLLETTAPPDDEAERPEGER